jgi:hypothetical protein
VAGSPPPARCDGTALAGLAADQAAHGERHRDGDRAQGELTQAGAQHWSASEPADRHPAAEQRHRRDAERRPQDRQAGEVRQQRYQRAPSEKAISDEMPASSGEGSSNGSTPSSSRVCARSAVSGSRDTAAAIRAAVCSSAP